MTLPRKLSLGAAAALATILTMALASSSAVAGSCPSTIVKCGCTIDLPGIYNLSGAGPMVSTGTCFDITASKVYIIGAPTTIEGPGSGTSTFGVHVEPTANRARVEGITAGKFGQGIRVDGPNASLTFDTTGFNQKGIVLNGANAFLANVISQQDIGVGIQINATATGVLGLNLNASDAGGAGIELNGASGAFLDQAVGDRNGTFGVWLRGASNNHFDGFNAQGNGIAGVYLGCNATGPNGTACPPGVPSSSNNSFIGSSFGSRNSDVSNTESPFSQSYGIAVGLGNSHNRFSLITGSANTKKDALDENPDCGSDRWYDDTFTTSEPGSVSSMCLD